MKRFFTTLFLCILSFVVVTLFLSTASMEAKASAAKLPSITTCSGWKQVSNPIPPSSAAAFKGVAAASANDAWAVGYDAPYALSFSNKTLIEHWNGTTWNVVSSPSPGSSDNQLFGVAVVSANDVWAVGDYSNDGTTYQTLIEQWGGTSWNVMPSPGPISSNTALHGVAVASANDIWAVGESNGVPLIEHWDGTSWSVISSPGSNVYQLSAVTVVSPNDVWAVGDYFTGKYLATLTEQWNGSAWSIIPSLSHKQTWSYLNAVASVSGTKQLWTVGSFGNGYGKLFTEQWKGSAWSIVPIKSGPNFSSILYGVTSAGGTKNVISVGYYQNQPDSPPIPLVEQWNGLNWHAIYIQGTTGYLAAISTVPGSKKIWAVGADAYDSVAEIFSYC
ncbi:MAG TPA: hypothetical protein VNG51_19585 [Ktedonobacteraceae bacterium]|nr:hypothetical protein [Ktedonobacteraceae bacterium]